MSSDQQETIVQKFKAEVDVEEFKRKLVAQLMSCTVGKNPIDFHLADLAATIWMKNFDKDADELEEFIRSTPVEPLGPSDGGVISVIDDEPADLSSHQYSYKEALLQGIQEDERDVTTDQGPKET